MNVIFLLQGAKFRSREIYWYRVLAKISNNKVLGIESISNPSGQEQAYIYKEQGDL